MYNFPISFFPKKILIIISKFLNWSKLCPHGLKMIKETSISNHIQKKLQKLKTHRLQCKKLRQKRILSTSTLCFKSRTIKGTCVWVSRSVVPDSLQPHGLQPARLLCPWDSPGIYWSGQPFPSPGDLPDPGSNPGLLQYRQTLYHLSHQGSSCNKKSYDLLS